MARVHELDSTFLKRPLLESVSVYNLWGHQLGKKKNSTYPSTRRAALPAFLKRLFLGKRNWGGAVHELRRLWGIGVSIKLSINRVMHDM
ncbi:hypothetical protein OUZ56_009483 [Daphnia magna]|uniref:Uncharacterized protein n=1 Tax=Daphnia magna TaxID=35525 RepID=A0ABR0AG43_9CRUS|nr:hypothetical protein OUZ56_009483 [Daphnia magna]